MSVIGETVDCDASASKYSYSAIFEYVTNALYPSGVSKEYKQGLRKRAAFFSVSGTIDLKSQLSERSYIE